MNDIINLRHTLHQYPELSNKEMKTAQRIEEFIKPLKPDKVISLASTGKAFVFNGKDKGKTVIFRAELDALPIQETSGKKHQSINTGISHACGHDGHMSILAGLAKKISLNRPENGNVVLLFQPAEEIKQGALDVVQSKEFLNLKPDYIFGLHNIPGTETGTILMKYGTFAATSEVISVYLNGKTSHAAEPEKGKSPMDALAKIINGIHLLNRDDRSFKDFTLATIVHTRIGEPTFGTAPGGGEVHITTRAFDNNDFIKLRILIEDLVHTTTNHESLTYSIEHNEYFPATISDDQCIHLIEEAIVENKLKFKKLNKPFRWSEDFGYYSQEFSTGFFGLGAGIYQPELHHPDYDFPDEILQTGIKMFYCIYKKICRS